MRNYDTVKAILERLLDNTIEPWDLVQLTFLIEHAQEQPNSKESESILKLLKTTLRTLSDPKRTQRNSTAVFVFLKLLDMSNAQLEAISRELGHSPLQRDDLLNQMLQTDMPAVLYAILNSCSDPVIEKRILDKLIELQYPDALALKARQYFSKGRIKQAETFFQQALESYERSMSTGIQLHVMAVQLAFHYFTTQENRVNSDALCKRALVYFENIERSASPFKQRLYKLNRLRDEHGIVLSMLAVHNKLPKYEREHQRLGACSTETWLNKLHQDGWLRSINPSYQEAAKRCDTIIKPATEENTQKHHNDMRSEKERTMLAIKERLHRILEDTPAEIETPWPIGYLGAVYNLDYKGRFFQVPREIHWLYTILCTHKPDIYLEELQKLTQESLHPARLSFFRHISGTAPSKQTIALFEEVKRTLEQLDDSLLPF